jgi:sugar transferase (PEP-CTERM/EpsH1 system associated)
MRVLQFAPRVCWPLDTGAKLRNYHLARVLAERARVSLLTFIDQPQSLANLEKFYQQVIAVERDSAYTFVKMVRGGLGSTPLPVLNYTTDSMERALTRLLKEQDFDVVQLESIHLMNYLPIILRARRRAAVVCDWHNVESELMQRYSEREPGRLRRAYAARTARLMGKFERRALREFDAHIVVSQRDAERLRALNSEARIFVIENGVDTAFYEDLEVKDESRAHRIVFVGSMDYHANIDGAVNFAREVWPRLRERQPDLMFTIVGKDPAPEVRELAQLPGIEVTGTVDDVRPFYREAIAAVVPLNVGGGSRLKILEAMAAGVPVVSTTLGAEGLEVRPDENILIADRNDEMVEAITSMIENESQRTDLSAAGRALVSRRYDWSSLGAALFSVYEELMGGLTRTNENESYVS